MGAVYKITNTINGKSYIGKTLRNVDTRWSEHKRSARNQKIENRPLYKAINKYGENNFTVETLFESDINKELIDKEVLYIKKYDTYRDGYNATLGGEGTVKMFESEIVQSIIDLYNNGVSMLDIGIKLGLDEKTVRRILRENNVVIRSNSDHSKKRVYCEELDMEFDSIAAASKYLTKNGYSLSARGASTGISRAARGERPAYLKMTWSFV